MDIDQKWELLEGALNQLDDDQVEDMFDALITSDYGSCKAIQALSNILREDVRSVKEDFTLGQICPFPAFPSIHKHDHDEHVSVDNKERLESILKQEGYEID